MLVAIWTLTAQGYYATYPDGYERALREARLALPIGDDEFAIVLRLAGYLTAPQEQAPAQVALFAGTSLNWMARAATGEGLVPDDQAGLSGDAAGATLSGEYRQLRYSWQRSISQAVTRRQERIDKRI